MENLKRTNSEYEETNCYLKTLHNERKKKKQNDIKEVSKEPEEVKSSLIFTDGKVIYTSPLNFISPSPPHFLSFRQLLYEDLQNIPNRAKTLSSALLTTFCVENEFIQPIISSGIKTCLVVNNPSAKFEKISENFTIISPKLFDKWGSFHAKLFLLKFPNRLRVVVTSANLISCDWSLISQAIWFQDFFPGTSSGSFHAQLKKFIKDIMPKGYSLGKELGIDLDSYNFDNSSTELVTSVPGRYKLPNEYGLCRIKSIMKKSYSHFTYQCSSIGSISQAFRNDLCDSFTNNKNSKFDIVYPSHQAVTESHLGSEGGGVFFLQEKSYESKHFPKEALCDIKSPEKFSIISGHLSHSKVLIAHDNYEINDDTVLYIGSHNLSSAAWGRFEKTNTQIFIKNYELGVVFVASQGSKEHKQEIVDRLPFRFPPPKYTEDDKPWFID